METKTNIIEVAHKKRHIHLLEELQTNKSLSPSKIRELQKYEGGPSMPGVVDTQEDVARAFGVAVRTVERWVRDGMPGKPDHYDLLEIDNWRLLRQKQHETNKPSEKEMWDVELKKNKAKHEDLKYRQATGELIQKKDVEKVLNQLISAFKRQLLSFPRALAPQFIGLDTRQIESILNERIKGIIKGFASGKRIFKK